MYGIEELLRSYGSFPSGLTPAGAPRACADGKKALHASSFEALNR